MERPVKKRPYQAVRRAQSASETKTRILQAAKHLFLSQGYANTTIAAIAHQAGVVPKTVHLTFGTKARLLHELIQVAVAGDDEAVAVTARAWWKAMIDLPAPRLIEEFAAMSVSMHARTAELFAVAEVAAASDPELAQARAWGRAARAKDFTKAAQALANKGALRSNLTVPRATGTLLVLASDATYRELIHDHRWSVSQYRSWLEDVLRTSLLAKTDDQSPDSQTTRS